MKKLISSILILSMLLSSFTFAVPVNAKAKADNIDYVDALYFENAPTVDGYISEAEWGEYSVFVEALDCATIDDTVPYSRFFYNRVSATNMDDYGSFAYYVWLRWSENYFYIGVKVNDANVHSLKNGTSNTWNGDAIQTRIDKAGANAAVSGGNFTVTADRQKPWSTNLVPDFLFGYSEIAGGFSEAWENNSNKGMTAFSRNPLGTAPCVVAPAGSNYSTDTQNGFTTYEVAIPWTYILNGDFDSLTYTEYRTGRNGNLQGGIGREFGMSLAVLDDGNDATAGWDAYMSWGSGICQAHQTEGALTCTGSNAVTLVATPVSQQAGYQTYDPTPLLDAKFSQANIDDPGVYYDYLYGDIYKDYRLNSRDDLCTLTYDDPADLSFWGSPENYGGTISYFGGDHGNVLDYTHPSIETTYIATIDCSIEFRFPASYTFEFDIKYTDLVDVVTEYEPAIYNWFGGANEYSYQCGYFFNDSMFKIVNTEDPLDVLAQYPYNLRRDNWYNWKFQYDNESCTARLWIDDLSTEADNVESGTPGTPGYTSEWGTLVINTNWRYFYYSSNSALEDGAILQFRQMNTAVAYDNVRIYNFTDPVTTPQNMPDHGNGPATDESIWNLSVTMAPDFVGANSLTIKLHYNAETTTFDSIAGLAEGSYTVDTSTRGLLIINITDASVLRDTQVGEKLLDIRLRNDSAGSAADLGLSMEYFINEIITPVVPDNGVNSDNYDWSIPVAADTRYFAADSLSFNIEIDKNNAVFAGIDGLEEGTYLIEKSAEDNYTVKILNKNYLRRLYNGETYFNINFYSEEQSLSGFGLKITDKCTYANEATEGKINIFHTVADIIECGEMYYIAYIPEESGYYEFYSDASFATTGYIMDEYGNTLAYSSGSYYNGNNFSCKATLEAGNKYYLAASAYDFYYSGKFNVILNKTENINTGYAAASPEYNYSTGAWTVPVMVHGDYFNADQLSFDVSFDPYSALFIGISGLKPGTYFIERKYDGLYTIKILNYESLKALSAGEEYFNLNFNSYAASVDWWNLNVTYKAVDSYVNDQGRENIFSTTAAFTEYSETFNITFTPEVSGYYEFYSKGLSDTYGYIMDDKGTILDLNDNFGSDRNFRISTTLQAGVKYTLVTCYRSKDLGSYTVCLDKIESISNGTVDFVPQFNPITSTWDVPVAVNDNFKDSNDISFNVTFDPLKATFAGIRGLEEGTYVIEREAEGSYIVKIINKKALRNTAIGENLFYCIIVSPRDMSEWKLNICYNTTDKGAATNGMDNIFSTTATLEENGEMYSIPFIPEESGYYNFYSSSYSDTYGYILDEYGNILSWNDDDGSSGNFSIYMYLEEGVKYFLATRFYSPYYEGSYTVKLDFSTEPIHSGGSNYIHEGQTVIANIDSDSEYVYYWFSPSYSGYFNFYSEAFADTCGYICDSNGGIIAFDDDSGTGLNFSINAYLDGGHTYMLKVRYYSSSASGEIPISVTRTMSDYIEDNFQYIHTEDGIIITGWYGTATTMEFPESINGIPVVGISDYWTTDHTVKHLIIPDSVVTIGDTLIRRFFNLETVTFGKGIRNLQPYMFSDCYNLKSITVSEDNEFFTVSDGVLYTKDMTTFIAYPVANGNTSYYVPDTVINIDGLGHPVYAGLNIIFSTEHPVYVTIDGVTYTRDMTKVIFCSKDKSGVYNMPDTVTDIADAAFKNCRNLTDVIVSDNVTTIVYATFASCKSLKSVTLPEGLVSIEESAFDYTPALTTIGLPSTLETIGRSAFEGSGLVTLDIPDKVYLVDDRSFYDAPLANLTLGNGLKEIGDRAFYGIDVVTLTLPEGLETIGTCAFQYCHNLSGIVLPDSLTSLGYSSFYGCGSLRTLHIGSGLTVIPSNAFYETGLLSVTFPETLQYIDSYAFAYTDLRTIQFNNPAIQLGVGAFCGSELETLELGNQMTHISMYAFAGTNIKSVDIPASVTNIVYGAFAGCADLADITIPQDVQEIGGHVFDRTAWFESQPDGPVYLDHALYSYKGDRNNISTLDVREGTTIIADYAFEHCYNLYEMTLPSSIKYIGDDAFYATNLQTIYYDGTWADWENVVIDHQAYQGNRFENINIVCMREPAVPDGLSYDIVDGEVHISDYYGNATEVIIPSRIEGRPVTVIGYNAFASCLGLNRIILPETVRSIFDRAFYGCQDAVEIYIPNSVTYIGSEAFAYCHSLTSVNIPVEVTSIEYDTFSYCYSLSTVYYEGTEDQWNMINIYGGNSDLHNAYKAFLGDSYAVQAVYGDVDGDGTVTGKDSYRMSCILAGSIASGNRGGADPNADIDGDGAVTGKDAFILKNIIAGNLIP